MIACGVLADSLIALHEFDAASRVVAAKRSIDGHADRVVQRAVRKLARHGVTVPDGGVDLLSGAVSEVVTRVLMCHWDDLDVERHPADHRRQLRDALGLLSSDLSDSGALARVITSL